MPKVTLLLTIIFIFACCATEDDKKDSNMEDQNKLILHVKGNKIYNEKGEQVKLRGVNVCGLEWDSSGTYVSTSVYEVFANWNCNIVRLPLSQDRWFGRVSDWSTPKPPDNGMLYRKIVDDIVKLALQFNKYIVLDLHWSNAGEWGNNLGQHFMPDNNSLEFWTDAAKKYANHPAVLFGLYNEPHDIRWEVWRNGGTVTEIENKGKPDEKTLTYSTPGHQKILSEIRKLGANNIIVAGGLDWAYDLRGINDTYALVDTPNGNGIVYDSHIYPLKEWDGINHNTKVLCIADKYPILVGEFGIELEGQWGAKEKPAWLKNLLDWMDANELHWAGWAFFAFEPPTTHGIIADWKYQPTAYYGAIVKERLLSYPNTNAHLKNLPRKL